MSIRQKMAATPFAHLLGISASISMKSEEDEERKQKADESDDDYAKRMEKLDDEDAKKAEDEKKKDDEARKAEEDKKKDEDAKQAKKAEESGDEDEKDDEKEDDEKESRKGRAKSARQRERARCAAIFSHQAAAGIPHVAANLAFNTNLSRKEAVAVLQSVAVSTPTVLGSVENFRSERASLADRMAANPVPRVGLDGGKPVQSGLSPVAAAIVAAGEKARAGK